MLHVFNKRRVWIMTDNPERFKYTCTRVLQHVPVSKKISAAKYKSLYLMQDRIRKHAEKKDEKRR